MHASSTAASSSKAVQLRITLDQLLGEHALLAIQATQRGYSGGADFNAIASTARCQLGCALEGDRVRLRPCRRQAVPGRQEPVARAHQVLRRLHGRACQARHRRPEEGGREPDDVHPGAGGILREGDRVAEGSPRQRSDSARAAAERPARRVREGRLRAVVRTDRRCVQAHVHDGRSALSGDCEAEAPRFDDQ